MKRLILALLLITPFLSAKHLYMGHFTGCSLTNLAQAMSLQKNKLDCIVQSIEHKFTETTGTEWLFCTDNDLVAFHWYIDVNDQFSFFVDIKCDGENSWIAFEKELAYMFTPAQISRKVIELK